MLMMSRQRYMHFDPDLPSPVVLVADPDDKVRAGLRESERVRLRGHGFLIWAARPLGGSGRRRSRVGSG